MKFFYALVGLSQLKNVLCFPAMAHDLIGSVLEARDHQHLIDALEASLTPEVRERQLADALYDFASLEKRQQKGGFPEPKPPFNAGLQLVSVEGDHEFIAPDLDNDARGPCPGLNAMANHGYLPRNGIGGPADFIKGTFDVFGMGPDLAMVLTTIGGSIDGNGLQWSIGGISKYLPSPVPGVLGRPQGISGSHNKYESDVSPTRGDLYKFGDDFSLQMPQFQELYDMGQAAGDAYSLATLAAFRSKRFDNSIATNPYFFNGPFSGVLVQPAAYEFIYRFMGNKSVEHPRGHLKSNVLMDFFSIKKDKDGKLVHTPGHERIPYNWYKRHPTDLYTQTFLTADTLVAATKYHKFASIGGNTGKVNSFKGVDPGDLTGGVINSKNILQGNNLACLSYEFQQQESPDLIKCGSAISDILDVSKKVQKAIGKTMADLNCPSIKKIDKSQFQQFPGYSKLKCASGTYP